MADTTVVIFGSNGMLGSACSNYFKSELYPVIAYTRKDFDAINDGYEKLTSLSKTWPKKTVVINAIGLIPQRNNKKTSDFIRANSVFPHLLFAVCVAQNTRMIHVTTDCVYDGKDGPYVEGAPHTEEGVYGSSKSCGEPLEAMVIRTSIIGEEQGTACSLLEWVRSQNGTSVRGFRNHMWSGVTTRQLAVFIGYCIENGITWKGVRHVVSPEPISKYRLLCLIKTVYKLDMTIEMFNTPEEVNKVLLPSTDQIVIDASKEVILPLTTQLFLTQQDGMKNKGSLGL